MTASDCYKEACKKRGVKKPSTAVLKMLASEDLQELQELEMDDTYVGTRGLMALIDVVQQAPKFRSISLAQQKIYNTDLSPDSIKGNEMLDHLIEVASKHPSLTSIDLSNNPLSNFAGRKLLSLATTNEKIVSIHLEDTRIDMDLLQHISKRCDTNLRNLWNKQNEEAENGGGGEEDEEEGGFGAATWDPTATKAPDLSSIGGGVRKKTVMGKSFNPDEVKNFVPPKYPKEQEDIDILKELLKDNLLFNHLDRDSLESIIMAMVRRDFSKGDEPIKEGDEGNVLYIIAKGSCDVVKKGQVVAVKDEKSAFGELELMYDHPCVATIRVTTDKCVTWTLDRDTYSNIVVAHSLKKRKEYEEYLSRVAFLSTLSPYEKLQLSDALSTDEWEEGDFIIRHGDEGEWMFLIITGTVEVIGRDEEGGTSNVCTFGPGDHFGELEFLNNHPCVADVKAVTFVKTAKINRKHFEKCLGPVLHLLERNINDDKYEYYKKLVDRPGSPVH